MAETNVPEGWIDSEESQLAAFFGTPLWREVMQAGVQERLAQHGQYLLQMNTANLAEAGAEVRATQRVIAELTQLAHDPVNFFLVRPPGTPPGGGE